MFPYIYILTRCRYYGSDATCTVKLSNVKPSNVKPSNNKDATHATITINKQYTDSDNNQTTTWKSTHRVAISHDNHYSLHSHLTLHSTGSTGHTDIHLARHTDCPMPPASDPLERMLNAGKMVEQLESRMRSELVDFYGRRVVDFCQDIRYLAGPSGDVRDKRQQLAAELCEKLY